MAILTEVMSLAVFAAAETAGHAAAPKQQLPQLDHTTFAGQIFWLVVTFGLLFLLLTYVIIPRVSGVLTRRAGKIEGDLAAAKEANALSEAAQRDYDAALAEARAKARTLADETRNAVRSENDKRRHDAEAKLATEMTAAESRIAATKTSALANVRMVAADTAAAIVERLSGESVGAAEAASAVDAALAR